MYQVSPRTSSDGWSKARIIGGASFRGKQVGGMTAAVRLQNALALALSHALHTCILVQIYAKSGRKGRQCVLRAIRLALSTPKSSDPRLLGI